MTAIVLILPVVSRCSFSDPDWREQYKREREAAMMNELQPPRTRPIVVLLRQHTGSSQHSEGGG